MELWIWIPNDVADPQSDLAGYARTFGKAVYRTGGWYCGAQKAHDGKGVYVRAYVPLNTDSELFYMELGRVNAERRGDAAELDDKRHVQAERDYQMLKDRLDKYGHSKGPNPCGTPDCQGECHN